MADAIPYNNLSHRVHVPLLLCDKKGTVKLARSQKNPPLLLNQTKIIFKNKTNWDRRRGDKFFTIIEKENNSKLQFRLEIQDSGAT